MKKTYKQVVASKYEFPTRVVKSGIKGALVLGEDRAKKHLERVTGLNLTKAVPTHSRFQWRWRIYSEAKS